MIKKPQRRRERRERGRRYNFDTNRFDMRRKLIRGKKQKSIERLDKLSQFLIPLTNETMRQAAELWAEVRNQGKPTASKDSLDIDVTHLPHPKVSQYEFWTFEDLELAIANPNNAINV